MKSYSTKFGSLIVLTIVFLSACSPSVEAVIPTEPGTTMEIPVTATDLPILYRGDTGRTGYVSVPAIKSVPNVQWKRQVGNSVHGAAVLAGDLLLVPTVDAHIDALDANTGETKWTFTASGDLFSSPAVAEDVVYVGNENGKLYALDLATGDERWSLELDGGVWTAPLVVNELIYVGSQSDSFYAVDTKIRDISWHFKTDGWIVSPPTWENDLVIFGSGESLYALNGQIGLLIWQKSLGSFWGPHAVKDGVLYAGSGDRSFYALKVENGEPLWSFKTNDDGWSAPAVSEDRVYFGNRLSQLYALDSRTGELQWTFEADDWTTTDPVLINDVIYLGVGNHDNKEGPRPLYAINAHSGQELWRFHADARILTSPAVGQDTLYTISFIGTVYALSAEPI